MNIYWQELKMASLALVYWTIGMLLCIFLFMLVYPPVAADVQGLEAILANFPPELRRALGLSTLNLASVSGFFAFIYLYILLIGSVFAMKTGLAVLSEEVRSKTIDFLLSKPVGRLTIIKAKLMAVFTELAIQSCLIILGSYLTVRAYGYIAANIFLYISFSLIQVQLFFALLGFFLAALFTRIKSVLPVALGIVFFFFVIQMINQSVNDARLAYFTPFAYFDPASIVQMGGYNVNLVILNVLAGLFLISLSCIAYYKRDFAFQ